MLVFLDHWRPDEVAPFASVIDRFQQRAGEILPILNKSIYLFVDSFPGHSNPDYNGSAQIGMTEFRLPDQTKLQPRSCSVTSGGGQNSLNSPITL